MAIKKQKCVSKKEDFDKIPLANGAAFDRIFAVQSIPPSFSSRELCVYLLCCWPAAAVVGRPPGRLPGRLPGPRCGGGTASAGPCSAPAKKRVLLLFSHGMSEVLVINKA